MNGKEPGLLVRKYKDIRVKPLPMAAMTDSSKVLFKKELNKGCLFGADPTTPKI